MKAQHFQDHITISQFPNFQIISFQKFSIELFCNFKYPLFRFHEVYNSMKLKLAFTFLIIFVTLPSSEAILLHLISGFLGLFGKKHPQPQPQPIVPPPPTQPLPELSKIFRTIDGSQNNLKNPNFGKSHTNMPRLTEAAYSDGKGMMIDRGNPRQLSNIIGSFQPNEQVPINQYGLNMLFVSFGQFIDHDLDLTLPSGTEKQLITVPRGDPHFDKKFQGNQKIQFSRSKFTLLNEKRTFVNQLTSFIDGSQVYGSDESTTKNLRSFQQGKLKLDNNMLIKDGKGAFIAGDIRVNQNIGLTVIQTIFAREHNRQCDLLVKNFPHMNDQQLFHTARNKIIGLLQKITFKEYLPLLLGTDGFVQYVGEYSGYNDRIDPSVNIQFSTSAFRIGHPLLFSSLTLFNYENNPIKTIQMKDMFLSFKTLTKPQQIDFTMNGMIRTQGKRRNNQLVDGLRNLLVQFPGIVQDLFSLNVQRGRDHGIPDYNTVRQKLGLNPIRSFSQISSNPQTVARLSRAYQYPNRIDLWVGIISEDSLSGGNLGEVGAAIVGETFKRIRNGDRFWYQSAYPKDQIDEIQRTSFLDVIKRNTNLKDVSSLFTIPNSSPTYMNLRDAQLGYNNPSFSPSNLPNAFSQFNNQNSNFLQNQNNQPRLPSVNPLFNQQNVPSPFNPPPQMFNLLSSWRNN